MHDKPSSKMLIVKLKMRNNKMYPLAMNYDTQHDSFS